MTEIAMPRLSDSMEEGTILSWLKEDGDEVAVGDELVEIETDKATMTYESPAEGTLRIVAGVGETLPVGAPIAQLGAEAPAARQPWSRPGLSPAPAPARSHHHHHHRHHHHHPEWESERFSFSGARDAPRTAYGHGARG